MGKLVYWLKLNISSSSRVNRLWIYVYDPKLKKKGKHGSPYQISFLEQCKPNQKKTAVHCAR